MSVVIVVKVTESCEGVVVASIEAASFVRRVEVTLDGTTKTIEHTPTNDPGTWTSSVTFTNVTPGTHTVTALDWTANDGPFKVEFFNGADQVVIPPACVTTTTAAPSTTAVQATTSVANSTTSEAASTTLVVTTTTNGEVTTTFVPTDSTETTVPVQTTTPVVTTSGSVPPTLPATGANHTPHIGFGVVFILCGIVLSVLGTRRNLNRR